MPRNIEVKARASKPFPELISALGPLGNGVKSTIYQKDSFYWCERGRLKLRELTVDDVLKPAQLIFYQRSDQPGPKGSDYWMVEQDEPEKINELLDMAWGKIGCVKKKRILILVGQTRIHFDDVEELGEFVELEVLLKPEQSNDEGKEIANKFMNILSIKENDLISGAYLDLLKSKSDYSA